MPSTSSSSSTKVLDLPEVEVLLATFNGENYLSEFLDSLIKQQGVRIHLRVSDDGSSDGTLEIIELYKNNFESCHVYFGPGKGPMENFFSLIKKSTFNFVALADQDDIWLSNHLISSLRRLIQTPDVPALTFSPLIEFGEERKTERAWPTRFPGSEIRTILTENLARGCTFVLNSKAISLIKQHKPQHAIMHDWWILILIYSTGDVTWSKQPEVRYRIHQNNVIGRKPRFAVRVRRFIKNLQLDRWLIFNQTEELLIHYYRSMTEEKRDEIRLFIRNLRYSSIKGLLNLVFWTRRYRSDWPDEIALRFYFIWIFLVKKRGE